MLVHACPVKAVHLAWALRLICIKINAMETPKKVFGCRHGKGFTKQSSNLSNQQLNKQIWSSLNSSRKTFGKLPASLDYLKS